MTYAFSRPYFEHLGECVNVLKELWTTILIEVSYKLKA